MSKPKVESYSSVWDAIADTPGEAANLRVRSELMDKIAAIVEASGWTQANAADHCGVTQPRINDLLRGRISRFSLDALVNIATAIGCHVHVELEPVTNVQPARARAKRASPRRSAKVAVSRGHKRKTAAAA